MCSSGVSHDGNGRDDGTTDAAAGRRSWLIARAIASMVAMP
jgi:hypothetical protein